MGDSLFAGNRGQGIRAGLGYLAILLGCHSADTDRADLPPTDKGRYPPFRRRRAGKKEQYFSPPRHAFFERF